MGFDWLKNEVKGSKLFLSEKVFKGMLFTRILDQMLRLALYNAVVKAGIWVDRSTAKLGHERKRGTPAAPASPEGRAKS